MYNSKNLQKVGTETHFCGGGGEQYSNLYSMIETCRVRGGHSSYLVSKVHDFRENLDRNNIWLSAKKGAKYTII